MNPEERNSKRSAAREMLSALLEKVQKNETITKQEIDATEAAINELAPGVMDQTRFWNMKQNLDTVKEYYRKNSQ